MKVYGNLERASFEELASNPSAGVLGRFWYNSTDGKAYMDKSASNRPFLLNDDKCIIGNSGTPADNIRIHRGGAGVLQLVQGGDVTAEGTAAGTLQQLGFRMENFTDAGKPSAGQFGRMVYITDLQTALLDTGAAWIPVGSGGGGGSLEWVENGEAPLPAVENAVKVYQYQAGGTQKLFCLVRVPDSYSVGRQIKMKLGIYSPDTSGTVLIQTVNTLVRKGVDAMSSTTNQHTSTNSAISLSGATVDKPQEVILDLTDLSGQVNGVAVGKGDFLIVQLQRGTDTATGDLRALVNGAEVALT